MANKSCDKAAAHEASESPAKEKKEEELYRNFKRSKGRKGARKSSRR